MAKASDTPKADDRLRRFVGYNLKLAYNAMRADVAETLAPFGLRMVTFSALAVLQDRPNLKQGALADALSVERPNLVAVVDELTQAGWVARHPMPGDRRAHALRLTPEGTALFLQAEAAVQAHDARMLQGIRPEDRRALTRALRQIENALQGGDID